MLEITPPCNAMLVPVAPGIVAGNIQTGQWLVSGDSDGELCDRYLCDSLLLLLLITLLQS
jgi:hypothetical protein